MIQRYAAEMLNDRSGLTPPGGDGSALAEEVLSMLPSRCRAVMWLKLEGSTNREIADDLGITVKAVEHHVTEARRRFRAVSPALGAGVLKPRL